MATQGSAREEAERLVATVLAMASQRGVSDWVSNATRSDSRDSGNRDSGNRQSGSRDSGGRESGGWDSGGFGALGDAVAGMVGQAAGAAYSGYRAADRRRAADARRAADDDRRARRQQAQERQQAHAAEARADQTRADQSNPPSGGTAPAGADTGAGHGHDGGWSTGSAECCACPICKVIASVREPSPEMAERLATGVGDVAVGVAGLLRAFSAATAKRPSTPQRPTTTTPQGPTPATSAAAPSAAGNRSGASPTTKSGDGGVWAAATTERGSGDAGVTAAGAGRRTDDDPWAAATAVGDVPTVSVKRAPRPVPAAPARPAATPAERARDPWGAATAEPAVSEPATAMTVDRPAGQNRPGQDHPEAGSIVDPAPATEVAEDRDAGTGDEARPDAAV